MKSGFTLIELLAVLVIITIISLIAIPSVMEVINVAKSGAIVDSAYGIANVAEKYYAEQFYENSTFSNTTFDLATDNNLKYKGARLDGEVTIFSDGKIKVNIWDGQRCAIKDSTSTTVTLDNTKLSRNDCLAIMYVDASGANSPELTTNMIPITRDITNAKWVKADQTAAWYDYGTKKWANVALVTESSRVAYATAASGTDIIENDVLAYLVWVPRYKYQLFNVTRAAIAAQTINIVFESSQTAKSSGATNGTWLTHPAFTFGAEELSGIWVGKFETTGSAVTPTVKPSVVSLRSQDAATQFATAQVFNNATTYGLTAQSDSHMMTNMEWGATAYLAQSIYGKNSEVWINPSEDFITGCAGATVSASGAAACPYAYQTANGMNASTTGNIYGIYDMVGGALEMVMGAMYNSGNATIMLEYSGFVQATIDSAPMSKYLTKYNYSTDCFGYSFSRLGDAIGETRGWYSDTTRTTCNTSSWLFRGSYQWEGSAGGLFFSWADSGGGSSDGTFRLVTLGI